MPQHYQESDRLKRKRAEAAKRQAGGGKKKKMDPITALRSKIAELQKEEGTDPSVISMLQSRLQELMDEKDPASALARKRAAQMKTLAGATGN
jgi:hypothetical protein